VSVSYDGNGNLLGDGAHNYTWDGNWGNPSGIDTVSLTYDALGRMVEQNRGGNYTQIVYSPSGAKLALMNQQTLSKAFVPLPGGATAVYTNGSNGVSLAYYRHPDWLGSSRLATKPNRTVYAYSLCAVWRTLRILSFGSLGLDLYDAYGDYQRCMSGPQ
jgi:YD repeat-containing protein